VASNLKEEGLMKGFVYVLAFALMVGPMAFATTTDTLQISSGGLTATIDDNGACVGTGCGLVSGDLNPVAGTDTISGSIGGWTLHIVSGTSNSPSLFPFGLDITSLTASCSVGTCTGAGALDIKYSDINFTTPVGAGGFTTTYSATITGGITTSESAFVDNSNTLFGEPGAGLIGTVGPFSAPGGVGSASGGTAGIAPYSLTLDQTFSGSGAASVDGNITAVPEPGAVLLLGTALVFCASSLRRWKASKRS